MAKRKGERKQRTIERSKKRNSRFRFIFFFYFLWIFFSGIEIKDLSCNLELRSINI